MSYEFFGFRENPFCQNHDIDYIHLSSSNKQLFRDLLKDIYQRVDLTLLLADWGVGEAGFLQQLIDIDSFQMRVMYFHDTSKWHGLVDFLCNELALATESHDTEEKEQLLAAHLTEIHRHGIIPVLIVDNTQELEDDTLVPLLRLAGQRAEDKPLIQVILAAVPNFMARFNLPALQPYKSSISRQYQINTMIPAEVNEYIYLRLQQAGCLRKDLFSESAVQAIADRSKGIPRLINKLCDSALSLASQEGYQTVDEEIIDKVSNCINNDEVDDASKTNNLSDKIAPKPSSTPKFKVEGQIVTKQSYPWLPPLVSFGGTAAVALILLLAGLMMLLKSNPEQSPKEKIDVALKNMVQSNKEQLINRPQLPKEGGKDTSVPSEIVLQNKLEKPLSRLPPKKHEQSDVEFEIELLMRAAETADNNTLELLLSRGISPDVQEQAVPMTALVLAAAKGHSHTVKLLLSKGATIDLRTFKGRTALMAATGNGHAETVRILLNKGAKIDITDRDGWTALMFAAHSNQLETAHILLEWGANDHLKNSDGGTALQIARNRGQQDIIELLEERSGIKRH